ncbi:MAG: tRNA pseudouridine(55) synthase TruB [Actinomycetota bacterium]|nr:tRNA pseudouridine(55) synthase TruB [Actinomycetota bacterium]
MAASSGLSIVDKPAGLTSHDVVARIRRLAGTRKVGHAGTLDPMATGVLIVGVERATRILGQLAATEKSYEATVRLGASTVTDDAEGEVLLSVPAGHLSEGQLVSATAGFLGAQQQVPSAVSAVKVAGRRAYDRVRAGEEVALAPRLISITRLLVRDIRRPAPEIVDVDLTVDCSTGTYIRALARDLGAVLGVGGHLTALRRTRVGPFDVSAARSLDQLAALPTPVVIGLSDAVAACLPRRDIDTEQARLLSHGRPLAPAGIPGTYGAFAPDGTVVALLAESAGAARPVVVLAPAGPPAAELSP